MRITSFFGALILFFFGFSASAFAHDVLVDQVPDDGQVLETAPEEIRLSFNNNLIDIGDGATVINVLDATGKLVIDDVPSISGMDAFQSISGLEDGAYRVVWRVVSSDGHPISGTSTFAFGPDAASLINELPSLDDMLNTDAGSETSDAGLDDSNSSNSGSDSASQNDSAGLSIPVVVGLTAVGVIVVAGVILLLLRKKK